VQWRVGGWCILGLPQSNKILTNHHYVLSTYSWLFAGLLRQINPIKKITKIGLNNMPVVVQHAVDIRYDNNLLLYYTYYNPSQVTCTRVIMSKNIIYKFCYWNIVNGRTGVFAVWCGVAGNSEPDSRAVNYRNKYSATDQVV